MSPSSFPERGWHSFPKWTLLTFLLCSDLPAASPTPQQGCPSHMFPRATRLHSPWGDSPEEGQAHFSLAGISK